MNLSVTPIANNDYQIVSEFILNVFDSDVAPHYSEEGIQEFYKIAKPKQLEQRNKSGAIIRQVNSGDKLVGAFEVKGNHLVLLFVNKSEQGKGIGHLIINWIIHDVSQVRNSGKLTVNSSPNALQFYLSYGFKPDSKELVKNGIRYTPMTFEL